MPKTPKNPQIHQNGRKISKKNWFLKNFAKQFFFPKKAKNGPKMTKN